MNHFETFEYKNALASLKVNSLEFTDLQTVLGDFYFTDEDILSAGGGQSRIAKRLTDGFIDLGWKTKLETLEVQYNGNPYELRTHKFDAMRGRIAVEIEWNNKDTFFDRDLNHMRLLYKHDVIDCGVIITRSSSMFDRFKTLITDFGLSATKYVSTTTHLDRLIPRIIGEGSGDCPVMVYAINDMHRKLA